MGYTSRHLRETLARMNISVVVTILNEAKSIIPLLDSLAHQSKLPIEVLLADGGSTDNTRSMIKLWAKKHHELTIHLLELPGTNRSEGRNHAIQVAKYDHIAVTDAGCEADPDWIKELTKSFESKRGPQVVAGYYHPVTNTLLQQLFALYAVVLPRQFDRSTFLPSSRSLAFTKDVWAKAGSYPEHLDTCEDLVFAKCLKDKSIMVVNSNALVYWHQPQNFGGFFRQLAGYSKGDVTASYTPHVIKILTVYGRYAIFALFPPLFIAYLFYPAIKFWRETARSGGFFVLPIVQLVADIAVMWGAAQGLVAHFTGDNS